jgi:hypothetical protein
MTPIAEVLKNEHPDKKDYWQNELKSLGIEPRRQNELNDKEELEALAEIIKEVYYQDYKTAYSVINERTIKKKLADRPYFDCISKTT